ncbi:hypothetical protein BGZ76_001976 [Entomortierella beljakovae]|nr:hypothetical protein BGZ76_001976 [Entomortierella beljakovae]
MAVNHLIQLDIAKPIFLIKLSSANAILRWAQILLDVVARASVAVCVNTNGPTNIQGREVVGFQLWNDKGDNGDQYRTVYYAGKTTLKSNGWTLKLDFQKYAGYFAVRVMYLSHDQYGEVGYMNFINICADPNSHGRFYYGCVTSPDNPKFCGVNYKDHINFCRLEYAMGTDTVTCNA